MTRRGIRISLLLLLGLLAWALGPRTSAQADAPGDLAVVVNPQNPVNGLTLAELRRIYLGEQHYWNSKLTVQLLVRAPGAPERELILKLIYQMSEAEYKQYWITKVFRGEASAEPVAVFSNGAAAEGVRGIPGAVACIDSRSVGTGLKVLKIDGKLPGDPGYPLRAR